MTNDNKTNDFYFVFDLVVEKANSGRMSPIRKRSVKDVEQVWLQVMPYFSVTRNISLLWVKYKKCVYPLAYIHGQDFESKTLIRQSNSVWAESQLETNFTLYLFEIVCLQTIHMGHVLLASRSIKARYCCFLGKSFNSCILEDGFVSFDSFTTLFRCNKYKTSNIINSWNILYFYVANRRLGEWKLWLEAKY